ncbi:Ras guanine nucleotide exchange factor domain [Phytophthora cactorum]|nr:Ras guanine nucleotide exchange factor domain [Phytophthora cactorum]
MASGWRHKSSKAALDPWGPPSPPPLLDETAPKVSKRSHFSRRNTRAKSQAQQQAQNIELEVEELAEQHDRDKRRSLLASMFGVRSLSRSSRSISDATEARQTLVQRDKGFRLVGNFVKMGWLTKQGHMWKSWKTRFFVLFSDGTFAYYKNKGRKKIKGCMQLNDGVVSVQHVDIRVANKAYVFQIEKGFYKLLCYCCSQFEAELWVAALRSVRRVAPPCIEMDLTATEEKAGSNAVTRHLNKIFITDKEVAKNLVQFKEYEHDHSYAAIHNFIVELDDSIIDRHHLELYQDPEIELLPGNELVRLIRRHVEDRVFIPLYAEAYASLETEKMKSRRSNLEQNAKVLKQKAQADLVSRRTCRFVTGSKLSVSSICSTAITEAIAQYNGELFEVTDETLTAVFRYVVTMSSLSDLPMLRALLKYGYQHHPACQNKANVVTAFLDAIKWIECFETGGESYQFDSMALAGSRVSVSISTNDVGIQFTTDGNGRGAVVYSVRKLSQAALSAAIVPGLSLIAINHEPVIGMPFDKIIQRVRTAALPKQLTFMTEFYYYQLLSLDLEMFRYLMCIAARRGDLDSAGWLRSSTVELNTLCSWEKSRGKQVFGFIPVSGKGSPLHAAVHNGQLGMVNYLIAKGADPNLCNYKGRRPLHVVKQSIDMAQIIQGLIDAGADIDATEKHGLTPLMFMCSRASLEGSATLLALGADVHRVAWSNGFSALEFAVKTERTELVELCLSKGANPNAPTSDGNTSLHLAAALAHADIILRLLQSGANPNVQNRYGQTPATVLLASAPGGNGDARILCLEILTCAGCRLDQRDLFGRQAAHLANISRDSRMVGLLRKLGSLNRGGNVDLADVVAFVLFLDTFSSLNEVVDRLSAHVRNGIKKKLVPLIEECTTLYRGYFSLGGAGSYALNYEMIPGMMTTIYGLEFGIELVTNEPFPKHLHRLLQDSRWRSNPGTDIVRMELIFCCISAYVINAVLVQDTPEERADVISFYLKAADYCMSLHNHDTLASILYALQSTAVQRLRKTIDCLSVAAKKKMNEMQLLSDKGCREMNRLMRKTANPSMPYIGLYLQGFVGLNELPTFDKNGLVNASRLRRMGELSMEILHRQSVAYTLQNDEDVDKLLHVSLPYASEESRYSRSLELEPREADAMPLSDRGSCVVVDDDLDLESEVRVSIGGDGTFGFRQWIRNSR